MNRLMVVTLAVLCLVFAGCGGDKDGKNDGEKPGLPGTGGGGGATLLTASAAGTYVLDTEQMLPKLEKMMMAEMEDDLAEMPEDQREMAINMAKASIKPMMSAMNFDLNLMADGTFTVTGTNMDGKMDVKGTWKQEGDNIWFKTTWEDGAEKDEEAKAGTIKDGDIHFKPEEDMPFDLVFKKK